MHAHKDRYDNVLSIPPDISVSYTYIHIHIGNLLEKEGERQGERYHT